MLTPLTDALCLSDDLGDYARLARALERSHAELVEALNQIVTGDFDDLDPDDGLHSNSVRAFARAAIAEAEKVGHE